MVKDDFQNLIGEVISRTPYHYFLIKEIKQLTKYGTTYCICFEGLSLSLIDKIVQIDNNATECIDVEDIEKYLCNNTTLMNEKLQDAFKIIQNTFNDYVK